MPSLQVAPAHSSTFDAVAIRLGGGGMLEQQALVGHLQGVVLSEWDLEL